MTAEASSSTPCPKCGFRGKPGSEACARCGLVFALWTPEKAAEIVQLDEGAERLWVEVEGAWEDEARHDAFLKHCSLAGMLPAAGRRYRDRLDRDPRDPIASRMQERILAMATVTFVQRPPRPVPVTRKNWFWAVLGVFAVLGMLIALTLGRGR